MRLPRDVGGLDLARKLENYGYRVTRQTGSCIRLSTQVKGEHHITIHQHKDLRIGTLHAILTNVVDHLDMERDELVRALFGD